MEITIAILNTISLYFNHLDVIEALNLLRINHISKSIGQISLVNSPMIVIFGYLKRIPASVLTI